MKGGPAYFTIVRGNHTVQFRFLGDDRYAEINECNRIMVVADPVLVGMYHREKLDPALNGADLSDCNGEELCDFLRWLDASVGN